MKSSKIPYNRLNSLKLLLILIFSSILFVYILLVLRSAYGANFPGDVDGNGTVNIVDLDLFAQAYGKSAGQPGYNPAADFWQDSRINSADLFILVENYGRAVPLTTPTGSPSPSISPTRTRTPSPSRTPTRIITSGPSPTQPPVNFLRAFPGAEGFGAKSRGGRGGTVHRITNLNDSGAGSLRACLIATGPRYCIFDISGTIALSNQLDINNPFITIAGETAPSPGITIKGNTLSVKTNDVIIRHLRIRVGDLTRGDKDAIKFINAGTYNGIADHISASWAIDENVSTWYEGVHDITFSNMIVSEALHNSVHTEGPHSKGILVGDLTKNISLINILAAHNDDRNFLTKAGGSVESINNLYYNWQEPDGTEIGAGGIATVMGNVYIKGPNTSANAKGLSRNAVSTFFGQDIISIGLTGTNGLSNVATRPVWSGLTSPEPAASVENMLYQSAGARPRDRDSVDTRVINEIRTRTGRIIDSQDQVGGWPNLTVNRRTFPVPTNPNGDDDNDGYTNLEELLHQHAALLQ